MGFEVNNKWIMVCLVVLLFVASAYLGSAVLSGDVTDSSGAAISGAELRAASKATGIGRTATTNAAGWFTINALSPGNYDLKVSAKGFSPTTTQVKLEIGQQQELKIRLEVRAEQINVTINSTDAGPMVNTTSSLVDGVISSQQIDALRLTDATSSS